MLKVIKKITTLGVLSASALTHATYDSFNKSLVTNFSFGQSKTTDDGIQGYIGGRSNQVSDQVGNVPGNRYNFDLEFDYNRTNAPGTNTYLLERRFHVAALTNDQSLTMYSLEEAYLGLNVTSKDHIRAGRQILSWSEVDRTWGFGKLNNRRNFDYFTPGQEGLIGLQYERRSSNNMRYRTFVSGLYIPEMNPSLDINKGDRSITSKHPWADVPATTAEYKGKTFAVQYDVDYPSLSEVIYRYTIGANIGYESKHWVMDNFVMRKPENSTTPEVGVKINNIEKTVTASITPKFFYHDIVGSTLKYRNRDIEMYVSGMAVRPNEFPDVDENVRLTEIKNKKRREDYVGGGISRSNDLYTLGLNYVARLSPFNREKDDLALDPRWNQAVNILAVRNFGEKFSLSTDLKYDMLTTDRLVMFRGSYMVSRALQMMAGVNMIGTPNDGKSYWSPYTNNDAVYGGLRYVY